MPEWADADAERDVAYLQEIVTTIRTVRAERGVPPSKKIAVVIDETDAAVAAHARGERRRTSASWPASRRSSSAATCRPGPDTVKRVLEHAHVYVLLAGAVDRAVGDREAEEGTGGPRARGREPRSEAGHAGFVERAPAAVVDDARARVAQLAERRQRLGAMLKELGA